MTTTAQRQCKGTTKAGGKCRNQVSGKFKYCPKHRTNKKKTGGKVNMIGGAGGSKVVPPLPKLEPYQVIVPCTDATGEDSGWHLMEDQIPQLIAHRLEGYKMPSFVKVTLGQGQFVFKKTDDEKTYEFRHEQGKRPKEFYEHTEVVPNGAVGWLVQDLGFNEINADRLDFGPSFYNYNHSGDRGNFGFYFPDTAPLSVHILLTKQHIAYLHVLSLQRTVEMCRKRAEDLAFKRVASMEGVSKNEVGAILEPYKRHRPQ